MLLAYQSCIIFFLGGAISAFRWSIYILQGVARHLLPRRNLGELTHDEFEIALEHSEVRSSSSRSVVSLALRANSERYGV